MKKPAKRTVIYGEGTFTAHMVRKLRPCVLCSGLGLLPQMLNLKEGLAHGSCVVETMPVKDILALPREERDKLRLGETGPDLMRKLMQAL